MTADQPTDPGRLHREPPWWRTLGAYVVHVGFLAYLGWQGTRGLAEGMVTTLGTSSLLGLGVLAGKSAVEHTSRMAGFRRRGAP